MRTITRLTVSAVALLGAVTIAGAQPAPTTDQPRPTEQGAVHVQRPGMQPGWGPMADGWPGMMGGGPARPGAMMGTPRMGFGPIGMGVGGPRHIEGRIAFLKAELAITDAQATQWNAFAEALRDRAARMRQAMAAAVPASGAVTAPDLIERRIAMLSARTEALRATLAAMKPLYAVLTDDQKKAADGLMEEHFMAVRRGAWR